MYGPEEAERSGKLDNTTKPYTNQTIPRVHWILSILCSKLFKNCKAFIGPDKENYDMKLGTKPRKSVSRTQGPHVYQFSPNTTRL